MNYINKITPVLILMLIFSSCTKDKCVKGNDELKMETRETPDFDSFTDDGSFIINYSKAAETRVDVFAETNILPLIETVEAGNTLRIGLKENSCIETNHTPEITLTSPELKGVILNGSGNITMSNVDFENLYLENNGSGNLEGAISGNILDVIMSGSGNCTLAGDVVKGKTKVEGSGNFLAYSFVQDSCYVEVSGSGDVEVYAQKYLSVNISGSGNVYYKGNPEKVFSNITGSGKLINAGE